MKFQQPDEWRCPGCTDMRFGMACGSGILVSFGGRDLSPSTPYVTLAIFPVAFFLGFAFNPAEFAWSFHHGLEPMPNEVRDRAENIALYLNFLADAILVGLVATSILRSSVSAARVGLHLENWRVNAAVGVMAGILLIALRLTPPFTRSRVSGRFASRARRGPAFLWVLIFIAGAFSEELWIAFCLVALVTTGHSAPVSIAMTMIAFAAAHYGFGLGGAIAVALGGTISALLFLWSGSLVPMFLYHFIGNLGSLYWVRRVG